MIYLSELVEELQNDVPAQDGVPTEAQYEKAIKDAIADFGIRAGRRKISALNIVTGTAAYNLPADFLKIIKLSGLFSQDGVLNTAAGLVPVSADFEETHTVANRVITFFPTPTYTMQRTLTYKAGWALSADDYGDGYEDLSADEAAIAIMLAKSKAITYIENAAAGEGGFSYRQGDVSVDLSGHVAGLERSAAAWKSEYLAAVDAYNSSVLVMG